MLNSEEVEILRNCVDSLPEETKVFDSNANYILDYLFDNFFNANLKMKMIFDNFIKIKDLNKYVPETTLIDLKTKDLVIVVEKKPLKLLITPLGYYYYLKSNEPNVAEDIIKTLLIKYHKLSSKKVLDTISKFTGEPLTLKEFAAVLFLLYNNSTSEDRGMYKRDPELRETIDTLIQSFSENRLNVLPTKDLNGAPGGYYMTEANRKLRNSIFIKSPFYYVHSDKVDYVTDEVKRFIEKNRNHHNLFERFETFATKFNQISDVLVKKGAYFYSDVNGGKIKNLFLRGA